MIDIGEIEAFLAVSEELHFRRAGQRLQLSASRISQLIRRLESRVGTPVLERTTRRVVLTAVGEELRKDLLQAYTDLTSALQRAQSAGQELEGTIRVGYLVHCDDERFAQLIAEFRKACPNCDVSTHDVTGLDYLQALRDDTIDVLLGCFGSERSDGTVRGPVMATEAWVIGVARTHPLADRRSVSVEELSHYPIFGVADPLTGRLHNPLYPEVTPSGLPIHRHGVAHTVAEVLRLVAQQENVFPTSASFSTYYSHPDVVFLPLLGWTPALRSLVWRAHGNTPLMRAFITAATSPPASGISSKRGPSGEPPGSHPVATCAKPG